MILIFYYIIPYSGFFNISFFLKSVIKSKEILNAQRKLIIITGAKTELNSQREGKSQFVSYLFQPPPMMVASSTVKVLGLHNSFSFLTFAGVS